MGTDDRLIDTCMRAAAEGPFFRDRDFRALFGMSRDALADWRALEPDEQHRVVGAVLNNLTAYPIVQSERWDEFVPISRDALTAFYARWKG